MLVRLEEAFNKCSDRKPFFGGDNVGLIDIALGSFLPVLGLIEEINGRKVLVEDKFPGLANWAVNFAANPAVTGTFPEIDKLILFGKTLKKKWAIAYKADSA
ncbi:glutathione s-transferase, partial [Stylosanthes scabra]|nr:glutathione s-transferase [Stylosanthes scabra]